MNGSIRFFICGSALYGEPDHGNLKGARFIRAAHTAANYRMHSVNDAHAGVYYVDHGGMTVAGEIYELTPEQHKTLLAAEPPDLYEDTVILSDGSYAKAMLYPRELIEERHHPDISEHGGWATYRRSKRFHGTVPEG